MGNNQIPLLGKETRRIIDNALKNAGWNFDTQVAEEYHIAKMRIFAEVTAKPGGR